MHQLEAERIGLAAAILHHRQHAIEISRSLHHYVLEFVRLPPKGKAERQQSRR